MAKFAEAENTGSAAFKQQEARRPVRIKVNFTLECFSYFSFVPFQASVHAPVVVDFREGEGWARHADQAFLGTCGFGEIDVARRVGDIGYVLAKPYWGQGYATEAAAAVLQFGFVHLGLRLIEAHAFRENVTSLRVMAKLGLRYRETKPMSQDPGAPRPVCVWEIERERWCSGLLDPDRRPAAGFTAVPG